MTNIELLYKEDIRELVKRISESDIKCVVKIDGSQKDLKKLCSYAEQSKIDEMWIYTDPIIEGEACGVLLELYKDFYHITHLGPEDPRTCKNCYHKGNFGELFQPNCNKLEKIFDGLIRYLDSDIIDVIDVIECYAR